MSANDKKKDDAKGSEPLLVYVGEDRGFWQTFKRDLQATYKQLKFKDEVYFETNPIRLQNLVVKLIAERPKAVFFDLSKFPEEVLHIVRVIGRTNAIIKPILFGLVDITTDKKYIHTGVMAGLPSIHVKTSETESMIYDLVCLCFHEGLEEHGFAVAQLNDTVAAFMPAKIGMMNKNSLLVESNYPVKEGDMYFLHTYWSKNETLISPLVRAQSQVNTGLYYEYEYSQELKVIFAPNVADVVSESEELSNEEYSQKTKELQEKGANAQKKFMAWFESNLANSKPKPIKVMVIDKHQTFFMDQPKTDEFEFVLRCQPYLKFPKKELLKLGPQLIVFHMEKVAVEELEANEDISYTYNETRTLQYIVKSIKSVEGYNPYIIVFNNLGHETKRLQEVLVYPNIVSRKAWKYEDIKDHWDSIEIRCWLGENRQTLYQEGTLAKIMPPEELLEHVQALVSEDLTGSVILSGTLAALTEGVAYSPVVEGELFDPVTGERIPLKYQVKPITWFKE